MVFFGDLQNKALSEKVAGKLGVKALYPEVKEFADGEIRIRITDAVEDTDVFVLKSFASPVDRNIMEFSFLIDCIRRTGANKIHAVTPYFAYMRADHMFRTGEAVPLEVVITFFESVGVKSVWMIDPHSIKIPEMFTVPVTATNAMSLYANTIQGIAKDVSKVTLVTPDMGGIRRIKILSEKLGGAPFATIEKNRDLETGQLEAASVEGKIHKTCFVVDDMISTGRTIMEGAKALLKMGAEDIYVMATHPVFAPGATSALQKSPIKKVFITDSIEVSSEDRIKKLEVLSLDELIASYIADPSSS